MTGIPIRLSALKALVKTARHHNVAPIFLPNYLDRDHPVGTAFTSLVNEVSVYVPLLNEDELEALRVAMPPGLSLFVDRSDDRVEYLRRFATYYVVARVHQRYFSMRDVVNEDLRKSEVLNVYPELRESLDQDGLLRISDRLTLMDGGILYRDHVLHYHQCLRRGFTSNPNFDFLGRFARYYSDTKPINEFRVAIDHRRIMARSLYEQMYESDIWYGALFDEERLDDASAVGLTVINRNKRSLFELTNQLDRTEFLWTSREGIKTFEIEEISDRTYAFDGYILNRYLHTERDIPRGILRHVDGAVKVYPLEEYRFRFESKLPNEPRANKRIKLWRIDGAVAVQEWIDLTCQFYKANEMVIKYFNPRQFDKLFDERIQDFEAWKAKQQKEE
jgi:hypothetical protein